MKTAGFLAFVIFGLFGSIIFIYYMWKPFLLNGPEVTMIAGETGTVTVEPSITPTESVTIVPTVFYGPDGIVYRRY